MAFGSVGATWVGLRFGEHEAADDHSAAALSRIAAHRRTDVVIVKGSRVFGVGMS